MGQAAIFDGKAPGFVGLDQLNVLVPSGVPQGCNVPLRIGTGPAFAQPQSQPVTVSIHNGAGQCVDPQMGSAGELVLKKSAVLNDDTVPESDTLAASFSASPGKTVSPPVVLAPGEETLTTMEQGPPAQYLGTRRWMPARSRCPVPRARRKFNLLWRMARSRTWPRFRRASCSPEHSKSHRLAARMWETSRPRSTWAVTFR